MTDEENNKKYRMTDEKLQEEADNIFLYHATDSGALALRELILREIERRAEVRRAYEQVIGQLVEQGKEGGDG